MRLGTILISGVSGMIKTFIQPGRTPFETRSVLPVREHGKMARTPGLPILEGGSFVFNIPMSGQSPAMESLSSEFFKSKTPSMTISCPVARPSRTWIHSSLPLPSVTGTNRYPR